MFWGGVEDSGGLQTCRRYFGGHGYHVTTRSHRMTPVSSIINPLNSPDPPSSCKFACREETMVGQRAEARYLVAGSHAESRLRFREAQNSGRATCG